MADKKYKNLTILHSNDLHGDFFSEMQNERFTGGVEMLSGYVQRVRKEIPNTIFTISGDMFRGSVIDSEFKGFSTIDIMNAIMPDVVSLGNHELDYGLTNLLFLEKVAQFPIINSNLYIKHTGTRLFNSHYIMEVDGMKILFIGILTQEIVDYAKQDHILGTYISVEQAALEVGKICNIYKSIDIDFTVLLTHIGFEEDLKLAKNLKKSWGVDLILGGHSHTVLSKPAVCNDILIAQAGVGTDQIGRFDFVIDTDKNCVKSYEWELVPIDASHCPKDKKLTKLLNQHRTLIDSKMNKVLTRTKRVLDNYSRYNETEVGNLFSDILKDYLGVDIVCLGSGSLRKLSFGEIVTIKELKEMYPFEGEIFDLKLTGMELYDMICFIFKNKFQNDAKEFYQWSKGLNIVYNTDNNKMESVVFQGKELERDKYYNVAIQKFHMENADKFMGLFIDKIKSQEKPKTLTTSDYEIFEEFFLMKNGIDSTIEGRIVLKGNNIQK